MRKLLAALMHMTVICTFGVMLPLSASVAHDDDEHEARGNDGHEDSRIRQGFSIAPVPLDLRQKRRNLVGLGSYIVNAQGGCNDCHTVPSYMAGGDPFAGQFPVVNSATYLAGGRSFGPGVVSKNLTPNIHGQPAGLTLEEFVTVMRTGRDPDDPAHILQVMPWPVYGLMTDRDLRAIYEYLKAIPSISTSR